MRIRLSAGSRANLNVSAPNRVNGRPTAAAPASPVKSQIGHAGARLTRKNFFVLIEYKNTNSVSTLPINHAVCKVAGWDLKKSPKNIKSNTVLTIHRTIAAPTSFFRSNGAGLAVSCGSTLSAAIEIIGRAGNKFKSKNCRGSIGRKLNKKEA